MAKSTKLISLIKEIVRQEVKKEVNKIFISEGIKSMTKSSIIENDVVEVLPKKKPKPKEKVTYTQNPVLNDILNETANGSEYEEYPTMGGETFDTSKMAQALGYGNMMMGDDKSKREAFAVQTSKQAGADMSNPAVQDVMSNLTKDYRGVLEKTKEKVNR